jgi:hypothetical protein
LEGQFWKGWHGFPDHEREKEKKKKLLEPNNISDVWIAPPMQRR